MNLNRIKNFKITLKSQSDDASRLIIVFVHSIFEDMLRQLAIFRLETRLDVWGDELPLPNLPQRKTKFSIGELAKSHANVTSEQLRNIAIKHQIEMTTFNDANDVASHLELLQFEIDSLETFLPKIQNGIKRRHKIVHEADMVGDPPTPNPITKSDVASFVGAVGGLILDILRSIRGHQTSVLNEPTFKSAYGEELGLAKNDPQ